MLSMLTTAVIRLALERRRRVCLRRLLDEDDRMLEDMGLRRPEIMLALALPISRNACEQAYRLSCMSLTLDRRR